MPDLKALPNRSFLGAGVQSETIEQRVLLDTAAANFPLNLVLPKGAWVFAIAVNIPSTISATTAVKVGVGRVTSTADPDKYWLSSALTAQTYAGVPLTLNSSVVADETLGVFACATDGSAAGSIGGAGQYIDVAITYFKAQAI